MFIPCLTQLTRPYQIYIINVDYLLSFRNPYIIWVQFIFLTTSIVTPPFLTMLHSHWNMCVLWHARLALPLSYWSSEVIFSYSDLLLTFVFQFKCHILKKHPSNPVYPKCLPLDRVTFSHYSVFFLALHLKFPNALLFVHCLFPPTSPPYLPE